MNQEEKSVSENEEQEDRNEHSSDNRQFNEQTTDGDKDSQTTECEDEVKVDIDGKSVGKVFEKQQEHEDESVPPIKDSAPNVIQEDKCEAGLQTQESEANVLQTGSVMSVLNDESSYSVEGVSENTKSQNEEVLASIELTERNKEEKNKLAKDVTSENENEDGTSTKDSLPTVQQVQTEKSEIETEEILDSVKSVQNSQFAVRDSSKEAEENVLTGLLFLKS